MGTKGVGTYIVHSSWASGNLVFYERAVGRTVTGDIFTIAGGTAGYVRVGGTGQDIDFQFYATPSKTAILDAGDSSFTLVGVNMATDAPVVITDTTATSDTSTGALIVSGGIAGKLDISCGDDLFLVSSGAVINFNAGNVTITHAAGALACTGALTLSIATATISATTGALIVTGGIGTSAALWVGTTSRLVGAITADATLGIAGLITSTSTTGLRSTATFVPDANRTNYALAVGFGHTATNELAVTMVTTTTNQNLDPIALNLNIIGANPGSGTINGMYQLITHDSFDMSNLRLKNTDFNVVIGKDILDAYCYQGEIDFNAAGIAVGGEAVVLGLVMNAGSEAVTGTLRGATIAMTGAGMPALSSGLFVYAGTGATLTHGVYLATQGGTTMTNAIYVETGGTLTNVLKFGETSAAVVSKSDSGGAQSYTIRCAVGGVTGYLRLYAD